MNKLYLIVLPILLMGFSACHKNIVSSQSATPVKVIQVTDVQSSVQEKILFVNLEFFKTSAGKDTCTLINTIVSEGRMKSTNSAHHHSEEQTEVLCSFLSCSSEVLLEEHIDDPLSATMEKYNQDGSIGSGNVKFERREVGLRVQIQSGAFCYLKIEKKYKTTTQLISLIKLGN